MNFLNTQQAAEKLGVSERRVRSLITDGKLSAQRVGRDYVIDADALEHVIVYGKRGRPPKAMPEDKSLSVEAATGSTVDETTNEPEAKEPKPVKARKAKRQKLERGDGDD